MKFKYYETVYCIFSLSKSNDVWHYSIEFRFLRRFVWKVLEIDFFSHFKIRHYIDII